MNIEQAIAIFERAMRLRDPALLTPECCEIALSALREKAEREAVVRGEWEVAIGYDPNKKVQCQNCYKMAYEPTSYCPNCGAKMEGKP